MGIGGEGKEKFQIDGLRSNLWGEGERVGALFMSERERVFGVRPEREKEGEGEEKDGEGGEGGRRKRGLQAEGYYEWIAWVGEDDDDQGFFEVVRSLESVVESAGVLKEGDGEGDKEKEGEKEKEKE